ncbi:hypothetical protein ACH4FX_33845 [Streptomyces sp. NPDC018019]|uniref:hypothetical protein n=1 Tax=Streptomyces sp. NPDC018019 TaxID=3365030 RepID=UPI0037985913
MRIDRLAAPELSEFWSLREDVTVEFGERVVLRTPWGELAAAGPGRNLREALRRMLLGPVSLANVVPGFPGFDVPEERWDDASRELLTALAELEHVVARHLVVGAVPLLSVVPVTRHARFRPAADAPGGGARLRDGVLLRPSGRDQVLLSRDSDHRVELHGPDADQLLAQWRGRGGAPVPPGGAPLPPAAVRAARSYVAAAGMLAPDGV